MLFEGGHGLVLLPEQFKSREAINTVIIGRINTREAARAITEALPLLRLATSTRIVCVEEPAASPRRMMGLADIAAHLDRQGVRVSFNGAFSAQRDAATIILEEAHRFSADLIVTGGYGHTRLREWIRRHDTPPYQPVGHPTTDGALVISSLIYRRVRPLIEENEAEGGRPAGLGQMRRSQFLRRRPE